MRVPLIEIRADIEGIFIERPNKYLAKIKYKDRIINSHVHDPGRLTELLFKGNKVLLKSESKPTRKTDYDIIAAWKNDHWVLIHSGYHRKIAEKIFEKKLIPFFNDYPIYEAEKTFKAEKHSSRIDFKFRNDKDVLWVEVKGCTLTIDNKAMFPDAPTKRGLKHLKTLIEIVEKGDKASLIILIFRKDSKCFMPNYKTDPEFSIFFEKLKKYKVKIIPILLSYKENIVFFEKIIDLC